MREGMKVDKTKWGNALIKDSIKTLKVKDAVQKKDYLLTGKYPIISQEKDFISGYCNTEDNLNEVLEEVIIFGDHTRIVKYVDFDFCVGADGVKVLRPNNKLSAKYLYYFIKWSNIPSNGYSRHFKFLKEIEIKYPKDKSIQQTIASELAVIQTMIDGYKAQLADLDTLAQSIFLDMFGDPVTNQKGWELHSIASFGKIVTGNTPSKSVEKYYNSDYIEWIKTDNIQSNALYPTIASEYLSEEGSLKGRIVEKNSILVCCIAGSLSSIGKCCITNRKVAFNQQINAIECNPQHNYLFSYWLIKCAQKIFMETASTGMKHILSKSVMSSIKLPVPAPSLQQQFANRVEAIKKQKELIKSQLADAEILMAERMQYYFS